MSYYSDSTTNRRPKTYMSSGDINFLRVLNPLMPLWWAMAMPGAGHIMLGKKIKGFILFSWEFFINTQAHLNLAIIYSCTGNFELAKQTLETRWFFIYIGAYIFNAWDAYRLATDVNQFSILAVREDRPIRAFNLSSLEINYLQKISPKITCFWSLITPGLGHVIVRNIFTGFFLLICLVITAYMSKYLEGVYYTSFGQFQRTIDVVDKQWFLFLPSIYCFAICDVYYHTIEMNQLFKVEQARYLKVNYNKLIDKEAFFKELEHRYVHNRLV